MINVARTYLPPLGEYNKYLKKIWKTRHVTNQGEFTLELTRKLSEYLETKNLRFTSNGTMSLMVAMRALGLTGEVITTPFSYVATTSSLVWMGLEPKFVDIESDTLCINPEKIEKAITKDTSAILATHVYGNPCSVRKIQKIADKHNLKVIYDAAHAFGVRYLDKPISSYGDVSIFSFHATKILHTIQGGAVISRTKAVHERVDYMVRFGHDGPHDFHGVGINGRNSDFHAAIGLCLLPMMDEFIKIRKELSETYNNCLDFSKLTRPKTRKNTDYNYAYYPVIFKSEKQLLMTVDNLVKHEINSRRYFYPSLDRLKYLKSPKMEVSNDIAKRVLCLPLYHELETASVKKISKIVNDSLVVSV